MCILPTIHAKFKMDRIIVSFAMNTISAFCFYL